MGTLLIVLLAWVSLGVVLAGLVAGICHKVSGPTVDDYADTDWDATVPAPRVTPEQAVRVS